MEKDIMKKLIGKFLNIFMFQEVNPLILIMLLLYQRVNIKMTNLEIDFLIFFKLE